MALKHPLNVLALSESGAILAVAYANRIQLVDVASGKLLATSTEGHSHAKKCLIRHLVWHKDEKLISSGEDKIVKEWHIVRSEDDAAEVKLEFREQRELPKRPNAISITSDGNTLVIGDKFGDVYAFPLHGCTSDLPAPPTASFPAEASTSNSPAPQAAEDTPAKKQTHQRKRKGDVKNPEWRHVPAKISALTPVLGHVSMLTTQLLLDSGGNSRIITADRDEHVRVSQWPEGWLIDRFLLGHRKFVSSLACLPSDPSVLLSAGGDDFVRAWSLKDYRCLSKDNISLYPLKGTAEITVEIPAQYGRRDKKKASKKEAKKNKKAKLDASQQTEISEDVQEVKDGEEEVEKSDEETKEETKEEEEKRKPLTKIKKLDLAIRKMAFVGGSNGLLVLSSVSSSALLVYSTSNLLDTSIAPSGRSFQLIQMPKPILDIAAAPNGKHLWVTLDVFATTKVGQESSSVDRAVRCFAVGDDNQLQEIDHPTVGTLNSECSEDLPYPGAAALYPDVALLTKEPMDAPGGGAEGDESIIVEEEGEE